MFFLDNSVKVCRLRSRLLLIGVNVMDILRVFLKTINNQRGCLGGSPASPQPIPPPPEQTDAGVVMARDSERRRRRAAASDTILTSPRGVMGDASTAGKTLLGQ